MEWQTILFIIIVLLLLYVIFTYVFADVSMLNKPVTAGNVMTTITPSSYSSANDFDSSNFTYSVWFYIDDWNYRYGEVKELIQRSIAVPSNAGSGSKEGMTSIASEMDDISAKQPSPFVMFAPKENNLIIALTCFTNNSTADVGVVHYVEVVNIPIQKWVNLYFSVYGRTIDVYINGKLVRTGILPGPAKILSTANVYLTPNGGFQGWTSKFQYFNTASNPQAAWDTYQKGWGEGFLSSILGKYKVKMSLLVDNKEEAQVTI
jgi:hypothetical protein